jgi:alpha-tubulin suppressor-like RCC1 family protein
MIGSQFLRSFVAGFRSRRPHAFRAGLLGGSSLLLIWGTPGIAAAAPAAPAKVNTVAAGAYHSLFLEQNGTLWASGRNNVGQLGDGGSRDRSSAVRIDTGVAAVAAGAFHTLFLKRDGSLWGTGHNGWGQLGDGGSRHRRSAVRIADNVQSMAAGYSHSLFVKRDGSLWA